MSVNALSAREREKDEAQLLGRMVRSDGRFRAEQVLQSSLIELGGPTRAALMLAPRSRGTFQEQTQELLAALLGLLERQSRPMQVTQQTVFLRQAGDQLECERLLSAFYGDRPPATTFVAQPPCCGAALTVEAWAIGGEGVQVEQFGSRALAVSYDGVRWVYSAGHKPAPGLQGVYAQTLDALGQMNQALGKADSGFQHVVRTWLYLGGITEREGGLQRYQELNRARSDFYEHIRFGVAGAQASPEHRVYPASTGIGMIGDGLAASCLTLQTARQDLFLVPLENPQQTPAYVYNRIYSQQSPKFSRAMALGLGNYVTTWISGTASIVDSESRHLGDLEMQTEQTIENIERLIAAENFARHGIAGAGAGLKDFAKIRVYLKRAQDLAKCRAVCERRFGSVPALYVSADVCRPELLVEIEGVAFSRRLSLSR
jgi:enamine deaminase RidA (YjgF/YER057c/UK114 family)